MKRHADLWLVEKADDPVVAVALHDGHGLREDVAALMALSDSDRLRKEDPFTGGWTSIAPTRVIAQRSRFEIDLNRPRDKAVYRRHKGVQRICRAPQAIVYLRLQDTYAQKRGQCSVLLIPVGSRFLRSSLPLRSWERPFSRGSTGIRSVNQWRKIPLPRKQIHKHL